MKRMISKTSLYNILTIQSSQFFGFEKQKKNQHNIMQLLLKNKRDSHKVKQL
jgi:hypothetical protein